MFIFRGMEWVGEGVVSVLGLDNSRFQDVLDGMTEEEMEIARAVQRQREQEEKEFHSSRSPEISTNTSST